MKKFPKWLAPVLVVVALVAAFFIYCGIYFHADDTALAAMHSTKTVTVTETDYGWLFDGPSDDTAMVFYPGDKVQAEAYAPLLQKFAKSGIDVCLVKMPLHLAFFDKNKAGVVMQEYDYQNWYLGGHSLGGIIAANYAVENPKGIKGVILCAAFPTKKLANSMEEISVYGSNDKVLNMEQYEKYRTECAAGRLYEKVLKGGNHAQFGSYGVMRDDGKATISPDQQRSEAVKFAVSHVPTAG